MKKQLQNILTFVVIFLIVNMAINYFFQPNNQQTTNQVIVSASHGNFDMGTAVTVDVTNNTQNAITIKNTCPLQPFKVLYLSNGQWVEESKQAQISCANTADTVITPGQKTTLSLASWNHALFGQLGYYKVQAVVWTSAPVSGNGTQQTTQQTQAVTGVKNTQQASIQSIPGSNPNAPLHSEIVESPQFQITPQNWFGWLWTTIFYQPIYNSLIFLISITPGHDLGVAIILLTLLIRTILLIPNQRALMSQRKLQDIQPKLNKIREKYKDNQEMIGKETLTIMQENKVNPFGSCLPILIQFPLLIALFYVVRDGLNPDNSYLLYDGLKVFDYSTINTVFLGILDLTKINTIILPIIVGGLQFFQMKLAFARNKKKSDAATPGHEVSADNKPKKNEMDMANNMMLYFMPAMIAIFTASAPAGVGIYWGSSTLYGIVQQIFVNKKLEKDNVKVRVIEQK